MFNWLKKFMKEESISTKEIPRDEVGSWLEGEIQRLGNSLRKPTDVNRSSLESLKKDIRQLIERLQSSELKNDKISLRERQYMEGNRRSYARRLYELIENLPDIRHDTIEEHAEILFDFQNSTRKSAAILGNYFLDIIKDVNQKMASIEKIYSGHKNTISESGFLAYNYAAAELKNLDSMYDTRRALAEEHSSTKAEAAHISEDISRLPSKWINH